MTNELTNNLVKSVMENADAPLSPRGIAEYGNVDNTSENLTAIKDYMFDLVEEDKATAFFCEAGIPGWFFSTK